MAFPKKSPSGQMVISDRQMACPINSGSARRIIFKLLLNARGQEVHESYINGFSEIFSFGANGPFLGPKPLDLLLGFFVDFAQWQGP